MYVDHNVNPAHEPPRGSVEQPSVSSQVRSIWSVFRRRFWMFLAVVVVTLAGVAAVTMLLPPQYQATARLKIDPSQSQIAGVTASGESEPDLTQIDTEIRVIESRDLAVEVADKLGLAADPEFNQGIAPPTSPADRARVNERIASRLLANLTVERPGKTYIVEIRFSARQAATAARIANAFANQYISKSVGSRTGTAERQAEWLKKRMDSLGSEVEASDRRIAQYRAASGIVASGATASTVTDQQIGPITAQLASAESAAAAARSALSAARNQMNTGGIDAVSAVLSSSVIGNLRRQRSEIVEGLDAVQTRYGPRHPETVRATQQLASIDQQIQEEAQRIINGLASEARAADARAASLRSTLETIRQQQARNARVSVEAASLERDAEAKRTAYNRLAEGAQQTAQAALNAIPQAQIVEGATPPGSPSSPNKPLLLMLGSVLAAVLGVGLITGQELVSSAIRSTADIEGRLGLPLIAALPRVGSRERKGPDSLELAPADVVLVRPMSYLAEAFRTIRSSLALVAVQGRATVVAIVSPLPGEGKTSMALGLARIMALSGDRVLLIDCDMRRASMKDVLGIQPESGLYEVLKGEIPAEAALLRDAGSRLDILPIASVVFSPTDFFNGEEMSALLARLGGRYDRIILDTPPLLGVTDARTVAGLADAIVVVLKWNSTPLGTAGRALVSIDHHRTKIAGAVLTMVNPAAEVIGAEYYSRRYAGYYRQ